MTGAYGVEPTKLGTHADNLNRLGERMNTAMQAADYAMSTEAYGLLCAFLPPIVNPAGEKAKGTLGAAAEGLRTTASNVRDAGKAYTDGDGTEATNFRSIKDGQL